MPDPLRPLLDHLAERYDIERELGGGGMSRVFLANERALGRRVVIKVLSPELGQRVNIDRFLQEVATSATLQHPQIVPVLHAGGEDGMRYYVMPFIAGESLRARLQREGKLDGRDVLHLIAPLARALAYAHRQGIVHRDVKPENILLSEGEPMLADFGIAKVVREDNNATGLTSAGMSIGTVTYMPPEQVVADPGIDGRADVYSLAAVAYELLTGQPPFTGTPAQVMSAHVVKPPADLAGQLAEADMALGAVIMRGLEKEPAQRPDAESFAAMLEEARGQPVSASRPALVAPVPRGGQRGTIMAIALAVAAVVAALVWRTPGSDAGTALAATPAIAVLNFEMIGPRDDAYLSAGVTDEITTGLAQLQGMRVLSRTTVRALADSHFTAADYAAKAGVRALVEGSVQRSGEQLRVSARLVDTRDGSAIWSDRYERAVTDVFRTQQEISSAVAGALTRHLGLAGNAPRQEYVADPAAYDLYLRARYALRERGEAGLRQALALFSEAALRDPGYARAHAGIAEAAVLLPLYGAVTRASVADTVRASAARAIAHDSLLAAPHVALGLLEKGLGRWADGERELVVALRRDPNDASAHQNLGELYYTLGRFTDSREALARAAEHEPTDAAIVAEFAYMLAQTGARDSARRVVARAAASAPRNPFVAYTQGVMAELDGDAIAAARFMTAAATEAPLPFFLGAQARAMSLAGDSAGSAAVRAKLDALGPTPGAAFGRVIAGLARDPADVLFAGLARAADEHDPFVLLLPLRVAWYDRVRDDARFAALAARLGLPPGSTAALR